jgi:hypothetical protein
MEAMRQTWSDDRLDALSQRMDEGFKMLALRFEQQDRRLDERFERLDERFDVVDLQFKEIDRRFGVVDERLGKLEDRFYSLNRTLVQVFGALIGTLLLVFAGLVQAMH